MQTIKSFRSFDRPVQVAVANMLANNLGFSGSGFPGFPWLLMIAVGASCAASVVVLDRSRVLPSRAVNESPSTARRLQEASTG